MTVAPDGPPPPPVGVLVGVGVFVGDMGVGVRVGVLVGMEVGVFVAAGPPGVSYTRLSKFVFQPFELVTVTLAHTAVQLVASVLI